MTPSSSTSLQSAKSACCAGPRSHTRAPVAAVYSAGAATKAVATNEAAHAAIVPATVPGPHGTDHGWS